MKEQYTFGYSYKIPKVLGGGKVRTLIRCGDYEQYKDELNFMINSLRRELYQLDKVDKK